MASNYNCKFCNKNHNYVTICKLCTDCYHSGSRFVKFLSETGHDNWKLSSPEFANKVSKWIKFSTQEFKEIKKKVDFLEKLCSQFRKETPHDIQLKPGDGQPCLPAHVAMLATRSEVLKNVVGGDDKFKSAASHETILTLSELNGEELECLVEFLYIGSLSKEMLDKHAYSLLIAADKYDIPYLLEVCETHIVRSISPAGNIMHDQVVDICRKFLRENMMTPAVLSSHSPPQLLEMLMKAFVSGVVGTRLLKQY